MQYTLKILPPLDSAFQDLSTRLISLVCRMQCGQFISLLKHNNMYFLKSNIFFYIQYIFAVRPPSIPDAVNPSEAMCKPFIAFFILSSLPKLTFGHSNVWKILNTFVAITVYFQNILKFIFIMIFLCWCNVLR